MTENAVLADELSRIVQDGRYSAEALGHWLNRHHVVVATALRAPRPEPAAGDVEAVARDIRRQGTHARATAERADKDPQEALYSWAALGDTVAINLDTVLAALAALAALPRPEADEGAVTALRAVMGLDSVQTLFEAAEEYPHGPEDVAAEMAALKLARAALAAAQEGAK